MANDTNRPDVSSLRISVRSPKRHPRQLHQQEQDKMKVIMSSNEMLKHAAVLRALANRFEQAGEAKLARKVARTKATIRRNAASR
jgi:hypothetical protein